MQVYNWKHSLLKNFYEEFEYWKYKICISQLNAYLVFVLNQKLQAAKFWLHFFSLQKVRNFVAEVMEHCVSNTKCSPCFLLGCQNLKIVIFLLHHAVINVVESIAAKEVAQIANHVTPKLIGLEEKDEKMKTVRAD